MAKLTREDREAIRTGRAAGTAGIELARRYGVSNAMISKIAPLRTKLTPDEEDAIRSARKRGTSLQKLAEQYRVGPTTIAKTCRGITPPTSRRRLSEEARETIRSRRRAGESAIKLAEAYRVSIWNIRRIVRGVEPELSTVRRAPLPRPVGGVAGITKLSDNDIFAIADGLAAGISRTELARLYDVDVATLRRTMKRPHAQAALSEAMERAKTGH